MFIDKKLTWRQLANAIDLFTEEQKDTDVTVYVLGEDEFYPMMQLTQTKGIDPDDLGVSDVLDDNHPYLVIDA